MIAIVNELYMSGCALENNLLLIMMQHVLCFVFDSFVEMCGIQCAFAFLRSCVLTSLSEILKI